MEMVNVSYDSTSKLVFFMEGNSGLFDRMIIVDAINFQAYI